MASIVPQSAEQIPAPRGRPKSVVTQVAGAHRLAAAKSLGWPQIECIEVDDDPIKAELWEIAENLHRCDLTKEQRDAHIRRYAELLESQRSLVQQIAAPVSVLADGRRKGPQHDKGVARQIAEETGLSVDTVRRAINPPAQRPAASVAFRPSIGAERAPVALQGANLAVLIGTIIEALIDVLDALGGDPDREDDDPPGQCDEDGVNTALHVLAGSGPGCMIADEDFDQGKLRAIYAIDQRRRPVGVP